MSFEKKEEKGKITFLGKKTELTNNLNDLLESNKCKLCGISKDLIKCKKCSYNFCKDCIKQKNHTFPNKMRENELICQTCQNIDNNKKQNNNFVICDICGNKFIEKKNVSSDANQEQKNNFKNDLNKGISLSEKEEDIINRDKISFPLKLCNNCLIENNEIIGKTGHKKSESKNQNNNNIIDILMNAISKEKGETNIFNILDSKSENSSDNIEKEHKSKKKENNNENEIRNEDQEKDNTNIKINKDIKLDLNFEEKQNLDNIKKNIENENINNIQFPNILGNKMLLNDYNLNINNYLINKNPIEIKPNAPQNNSNEQELLKTNLHDRNLNSFLTMPLVGQMPPPSININSNNKTTKIYLPHFFTTTPLNNNQNINTFISNINNNIPRSIIDMQKANNNINSINDINLQINKNQIINEKNNLKAPNSPIKPISNNNKFNYNEFNQIIPGEKNKTIIPITPNINSNNNILNYDINQNKLNANINNNSNEGINKLMGTMSINNKQLNMKDNNMNNDLFFNSINNPGNNLNTNIHNNLIGMNNEIKATLCKISKDLYTFDNNNIENNLNILSNIQTITDIFSQIVGNQNSKFNIFEGNLNNMEFINNNLFKNQSPSKDNEINVNKNNNENKCEEQKDNINNQQNNEKNLENVNNINLNEIENANPSTKALIKYILSVNESLRSQLKGLKMYIEIQKVFVSIICQNLEVFHQNLIQGQSQSYSQKPIKNNKDLTMQNNPNNILSQMKDISPPKSQNNIISQINNSSQIPLNTFSNLQSINPVNPSSNTLLNAPNMNYNSPILISPIPQFLQNNNINRGLSLFNFPGQQFKQEFGSNIPNIFNGAPHLPLYLQQQGVNTIGNPIMGQNINQMIPIINPINSNESNIINNNLEQNKNTKNN